MAQGAVSGFQMLDLGLDREQVWVGFGVGAEHAVRGVSGICWNRGLAWVWGAWVRWIRCLRHGVRVGIVAWV